MTQIRDLQKEARDKRDLAARARRLALTQLNKADQERLNRYADEMEQLADELEAQAAAQHPNPAPVVTYQQQQVQQQHEKDPEPAPENTEQPKR